MNKDNHDIEQIIAKTSFREISNEEQSLVWSQIESKSHKKLSFLIIKKPMLASIIVALALALGVGGTVVTADNAGPGDLLFGVDQAVEKVRISLAGPEKKNDLRIQFAGERMKEVEHLSPETPAMSRPAAADVTETSVTKIEADVFQNETVIKIEYGTNKKFVFTNNAKTKTEVVADVMKNFTALSKTFIEAKLDFEAEDRSSRPEDKGVTFSSKDSVNVTTGLNAALTLLNGVSASLNTEEATKLKSITDQLNAYLITFPKDTATRDSFKDDDQKTRVDLRTEDGRIRVEIKDGEMRIKIENKEEDDDEDKKSEDSSKSSYRKSDDSTKGNDRDDDEDEGEDRDDDDEDRGGIVTPPIVVTPPPVGSTVTSYTLADVKLHNTKASCWTAVMGSVYDVTPWISQHPGGSAAIIGMCGIDASAAFNGQHGGASRPASELASFKIGVLK